MSAHFTDANLVSMRSATERRGHPDERQGTVYRLTEDLQTARAQLVAIATLCEDPSCGTASLFFQQICAVLTESGDLG